MSKIVIDTEKITYGLEKGLSNIRDLSGYPSETILRYSVCGFASTAIHLYAVQKGIASQPFISEPKLSIDPEMKHVFTLVGVNTQNPTIVDATASQFLNYAGLSPEYERLTGEIIYPPEKVFAFEFTERMIVVEWLASVVKSFQQVNQRPIGDYNRQYGVGPMADASYIELVDTYSKNWEAAYIKPWQPSARVIRGGLIASQSIPSDAIEVVD